jgi:hypothetical protein
MASIWLHDYTRITITPADLVVDQADIVLILQTLGELAPDMRDTQPPTFDRLARLFAPYVTGVTPEALGRAFVVRPFDVVRVLNRVLLFVLYQPSAPAP